MKGARGQEREGNVRVDTQAEAGSGRVLHAQITSLDVTLIYIFAVLGMEARPLHMLGKCSITELHP